MVVLAAVAVRRPAIRLGGWKLVIVLGVGLGDTLGNVLFAGAASQGGLESLTSVLASLYPIVTVMLAAFVLHERVASVQRLGAALALTGIVLISALDVEPDVEDVAVADDVGLPFEPLVAAPGDLGVRARFDELLPVHDLAADEPARDVGVDRRRRVEGGLAAAERPRPRLLLARREEGDQVELVAEPARYLVERRQRRL